MVPLDGARDRLGDLLQRPWGVPPTELAVYTGADVHSLKRMHDRAGSIVRFRAVAGTTYAIATNTNVDFYSGGTVPLSWRLRTDPGPPDVVVLWPSRGPGRGLR